MTAHLLAQYEITQAIELLQGSADFTKRAPVHSMADVKTRNRKQRQAWQRIFDFRQAMKEQDMATSDVQAKKLLLTYQRYRCTQTEAHHLTGIPKSSVYRITRYVPAVQKAYQKARNYRKNQARQARRRKRAKNDQV